MICRDDHDPLAGRFTPAELPSPSEPLPFVAELPGDWEGWLLRAEVVARTPFLLSPSLEYDVVLNGFFQSAGMVASAWNTQAGYARDLAAFLTFLWSAREGRSWREARCLHTNPYFTRKGVCRIGARLA